MNEMALILEEIQQVMGQVESENLDETIQLLSDSRRIFVLGEGRSGLQGKGFAMRLMHIGLSVYVIGESTTPSIQPEDTLVAISGSGTTSTIVSLAKKAKENGVTVLGVTSNPESPLAQVSDTALIIPGATKTGSGIKSIQLLSSLFDQTLHITLDYVCLIISKKKSISNEQANQQHSNME